MSFLFSDEYWRVKKNGVSPGQMGAAYLGGSLFQSGCDNFITSFRNVLLNHSKDTNGKMVDPKIAFRQTTAIFMKHPLASSFAGLNPRIIGVFTKRVPKFGFLLGYSYVSGNDGKVGAKESIFASLASAPFIAPWRLLERQQRLTLRETGKQRPMMDVVRECATHRFLPLFRGSSALAAHSMVSALLGLSGQPILQAKIETHLGENTTLGKHSANIIASAIVSPFYVIISNPVNIIENKLMSHPISEKRMTLQTAMKEYSADIKEFGIRGLTRSQNVGIVNAVISLSLFHMGRMSLADYYKARNERLGLVPN